MPMSGWVLHSDPASAGCRPGRRRCAPVSPCPGRARQPREHHHEEPAPVSAPTVRVESQPPRFEEAWSEHLGVFACGARCSGRVVPRPEVSVPATLCGFRARRPQGRGNARRPAPGAVPSTAPTTNTPRCSDQASSNRGGWDSTRRRRGADTGAGPRGGARVGCHEHAPGQGLTGAQRRRPGLHPALAGSLWGLHPYRHDRSSPPARSMNHPASPEDHPPAPRAGVCPLPMSIVLS